MTTVIPRTRSRAGASVHTPAQRPSPSTPVSAAGPHCTQSKAKQCIKRIRRRLERWELPHLRELAGRLAAELDEMTARAERAERDADMWHDQTLELINIAPEGTTIGLTMDGTLHVFKGGAA